jgi:hypothetical protein
LNTVASRHQREACILEDNLDNHSP